MLYTTKQLKFICSEKDTKFCENFTLFLSYVLPVKSKVKILQSFVAFLEYMNFTRFIIFLLSSQSEYTNFRKTIKHFFIHFTIYKVQCANLKDLFIKICTRTLVKLLLFLYIFFEQVFSMRSFQFNSLTKTESKSRSNFSFSSSISILAAMQFRVSRNALRCGIIHILRSHF